MILVDTSVWIEHLRQGVSELATALDAGSVLMHPFVIGELACGNLKNRGELLHLLENMPPALLASEPEAMAFIEQRALMGRGIGHIDVHLLASVALTHPARLWTRDRRLGAAAAELGLGAPAPG